MDYWLYCLIAVVLIMMLGGMSYEFWVYCLGVRVLVVCLCGFGLGSLWCRGLGMYLV